MMTRESTNLRTRGAPPSTRTPRIVAALATFAIAAVLTACGANQSVDAALDDVVATMLVVTDAEAGTNHELAGSTVTGRIYVLVDAPRSIQEVQFVLDDAAEPLKIDTSTPFDLVLDTTGLAEGHHTIRAFTPSGGGKKLRLLSTAEFTIANVPIAEDPPGDEPAPTEPAPEPEPTPEPDPEPVPEPEPTPEPTPDPGIIYGGPITITQGGTYSGNWESLDRTVPAVLIKTSEPVVIENAFVQGAGHLISAPWVNANVTVRNVVGTGIAPTELGDAAGRFVAVEGFERVVIENSYFEGTMGIYLNGAAAGASVRVLRNQARNIDGRRSDGAGGYSGMKFAQFLQINAGDDLTNTEVAWNHVVNDPYLSLVEDVINFYQTSGTASDPILVHHNYIQGAYAADPKTDAYSGGGIMVGDAGGAYTHVYENHVVGTSNYGIAISGGHDNRVFDNRVVSCGYLPDGTTKIAAQNVGMYVWNMRDELAFGNNQGTGNAVGWNGATATRNDWWVPDAADWTGNLKIDSGTSISCSAEQDELLAWHGKATLANVVVGPNASTAIASVPTVTTTN